MVVCPGQTPLVLICGSWCQTSLYIRAAHTFSACELRIKWPSQNDLPTTKMQNLTFLFTMYVQVPCIPAWAHIAQHNTINYVHFWSLPEFTLMTCTEWNQPGRHSPDSSCRQPASSTLPNDHQSWWNGTLTSWSSCVKRPTHINKWSRIMQSRR